MVEGQDFQYGKTDCCTFSLDAVKSITGVDICPSARGAYSTKRSGMAWLKAQGANSLDDFFRRIAIQHGLEEVAPMFSMVGDIAVLKTPGDGQSLGIRWVKGFVTRMVGSTGFASVYDPITCWRV